MSSPTWRHGLVFDITAITDGDTSTAIEIMKRNHGVPTTRLDHDSGIGNRAPFIMPGATIGERQKPAPAQIERSFSLAVESVLSSRFRLEQPGVCLQFVREGGGNGGAKRPRRSDLLGSQAPARFRPVRTPRGDGRASSVRIHPSMLDRTGMRSGFRGHLQ